MKPLHRKGAAVATTPNARSKSAETRVNRTEYLKDPFYYASLANDRHRVFVIGETGDVVKVIGGHVNYKQTSGRRK